MKTGRWAGRSVAAVAAVAGLLFAQSGTALAVEHSDYVDGAWLYMNLNGGSAQGRSGGVYNAIWMDRTLAPGAGWEGPLGKRYGSTLTDSIWAPNWYWRTCVDAGSNGIRCGSWW
ncbi:MAG: hypothetical protein ABW215_22760 [Kibdelosporangium sp.]